MGGVIGRIRNWAASTYDVFNAARVGSFPGNPTLGDSTRSDGLVFGSNADGTLSTLNLLTLLFPRDPLVLPHGSRCAGQRHQNLSDPTKYGCESGSPGALPSSAVLDALTTRVTSAGRSPFVFGGDTPSWAVRADDGWPDLVFE